MKASLHIAVQGYIMNDFMDSEVIVGILQKINHKQQKIKCIDIGGLEPLMYNLNNKNIIDFITSINNIGIKVKITTNASLLSSYYEQMQNLDVEKIRISLHTVNEVLFNNISNSDLYHSVINSILKAKEKLKIEINTIVFKGYEGYAMEVVDFAIKNNLPLKLYNLYKNHRYASEFDKYYISSAELSSLLSSKLSLSEVNKEKNHYKRDRTVFKSIDNIFTIKDDIEIDRNNEYCRRCAYINSCSEKFGEYLRVDPDLTFYPCYLRKDIRFNLLDDSVLESLEEQFGAINLRLIVSRHCNFKCCFPNSNKTWCLKVGGEYKWLM